MFENHIVLLILML